MQKYLQTSRKTENVQILFKGICAKLYANFLLFMAFQITIRSKNPMTGSRSKYRFSRVKVK